MNKLFATVLFLAAFLQESNASPSTFFKDNLNKALKKKVKLAKPMPIKFNTLSKQLEYKRKLAFEGKDSAKAYIKHNQKMGAVDYLELTGGTLTGMLSVSSGNGSVVIHPSDNSHAGFIELFRGDGTTRNGYIGFSNSDMYYSAENGASHFFSGDVKLSSNLTVGGGVGGVSGRGIIFPSSGSDLQMLYGEHDGSDASNLVFHQADNQDDGVIFRNSDCCGGGTLDYMKIARNKLFYIGGNVGIGTTDPGSTKLVVSGSGNNSLLLLKSTGTYSELQFNNSNHTSFIGDYADGLRFYSNNGGTPAMLMTPGSGNILIGKTSQTNTAYKLDVDGIIRANKVVVNTTGADFVFDSSYKLPSLETVADFIKANKHLPQIASAEEMQKNGLDVGENQTKLLQKIEELTLYAINQEKAANEQEKTIKRQAEKLKQLEEKLNKLLAEKK